MADRRAVVVAGPPAAGKTSFAGLLAARLPHAVVVDKDEVTGPLVRAALVAADEPLDLDGAYYKRWLSPACYEATLAVATAVLDAGGVPIVVAPYESALRDPEWHDSLRRRLGVAHLQVIWTVASAGALRERMQHRGAARDVGKLERWDAYAVTLPTESPPWPHVHLDTTGRSPEDLDHDARTLAESLGPRRPGN